LLATLAYDKKLFSDKNVDPLVKVGSNRLWMSNHLPTDTERLQKEV
jgi:hypothetical protein